MKRKDIALIYILMLTFATLINFITPKPEAVEAGTQTQTEIIPAGAIRLRILANSNTQADQQLKRNIRDVVKADMDTWVTEATSAEEAKSIVQTHLPKVQTLAEHVVAKAGSNQTVTVKLQQAEFPTKLYGDFLYPAGKYESLVISIGEAKGNNWWCVLYPPLCFLDFESGTAITEEEKETEIEQNDDSIQTKFVIQEMFEKWF